MPTIKLKPCDHFCDDLQLPRYESDYASGADIRACLGKGKQLEIRPGERLAIPTGLKFEIPCGFEIQVRPRSGLSLKTPLMIVNGPGTIDSDYRGEVKILMGNMGLETATIKHGMRIAQLVLAPVIQAQFELATRLSHTRRDEGGLGSTGVF